jgi:hypothetical protein
MDLATLDSVEKADDGATLEIRSPIDGAVLTDEATKEPVTVTVLGVDSKEYRRQTHRAANRRLKQGSRSGRIKITAEELEAEAIDLLVSVTMGWTHVEVDGTELECTPQNVRLVYDRFPWLREQVDEFVLDRTNFLGN